MLELFKQTQVNKDFRVIITSNILEDYDEDEIKSATISRHVNKPFSPARILKIFSDEYNSVRVVSNLEELLLMEEEEDSVEDEDIYGLKKYNEPMVETKGVDKESLRAFFGSTILIVEDDRLNRKILERMLESTGIKYAVASSTDGTLEQLKKYYNHFDLILMNIAISNMSGYTLAKMIRYDKSFDNIPIVAMVEEKDKAIDLAEAGVNGYIIKPIKMGVLYTICDRFLEKVDIENNDMLARLSKSEHILDITRGIMLADNNQENYITLLEEFVNAYGNSSEDFESLIINREYEKAKLLAMDMKGLTSIIAANNMNRLITEIERINTEKEYRKLDKYIERYTEELDELVTNIEIYIRSVNN
jgi:CheY-like chemotaxis protein